MSAQRSGSSGSFRGRQKRYRHDYRDAREHQHADRVDLGVQTRMQGGEDRHRQGGVLRTGREVRRDHVIE